MMFRRTMTSQNQQWRTLDRLSRAELTNLRAQIDAGLVENVSGDDAADQALVQIEILLEAPSDCLFSS